MPLVVGKDVATGKDVVWPVATLARHVAVLGATGSGKTVLCKAIVEEAVRNGIPVLAVDPQGDVASLALRENPTRLSEHGTPLAAQQEFLERARVAIFTPASSKGIPLSVNPLRFPGTDVPREEAVLAIDMTASSLAGILGYDLASPAGKAARACLFSVMDASLRHNAAPKDLDALARAIVDPPAEVASQLAELIGRKEAEELARKLKYLTVGASSLLFEMGVKLDLDTLLDRRDGKVPVNVVYLNSLASEADKQFFLTAVLRETYLWMLRHPSKEVQLLLYVDEVAPYLPPYPRNPPPKEAYALLFKQARKYGVSLLAATQNITDIDYKALGQANTWCLGRLVMPQDVARVSKIVQSVDPLHTEQILGSLPGLAASEFFAVSPDVRDQIVRFRTRWLVTEHRTLEESELADAMGPATRSFFERAAPPPGPAPSGVSPAAPSAPAVGAAASEDAAGAALTGGHTDEILAALEVLREAVPARAVADAANLPLDTATRELGEMTKAGVVASGVGPASRDRLYWPVGVGYQPALGLTREVLEIRMRLAQVDIVRHAAPLLERERLAKAEEVAGAELEHIPVWKVTCQWTTKPALSAAKEHLHDYYVSARSGAFMTIHGKEMGFERVARERAENVQDVSDEPGVDFDPVLPRAEAPWSGIRVSLPEAAEMLRRTFGVQPTDGRLALLPVWHLSVRRKDGLGARTLAVDAVLGKTVSGDF